MKLLLDISAARLAAMPPEMLQHFAGQMLTPLSRYRLVTEKFAVDNGAFTKFRFAKFDSLLRRNEVNRSKRCLWVAVPDVVGSARRTLEIWKYRRDLVPHGLWPLAFVCQDGAESLPIPWDELAAVFIGGTTAWKMSEHAAQIIKTAKILNKLVHIGRVNTPRRWRHFAALGADTCDGSGIARFDWMLKRVISPASHPLFDPEVLNG
jgi:hypothetical protein